MANTNYYSVLGVDKGANQDDIKKAFRKQAKRYHPDANRDDPAASERFKEVNEAYEVLGDPEKRKQYDTFGTNWQQFQNAGAGAGAGGPYTQNFRVEDLEDLFGGFGGAGRSGGFNSIFEEFMNSPAGATGRRQTNTQGQDYEQAISISLREAYAGATRLLNKGGRQIRVNVPAGVATGKKIRLAGEGAQSVMGGAPGDLYLVVEVQPDPQFERDGDDLYTDVQIDALTAMLGGEAEVHTMTRPLKLTIPAGTQAGKKFRLSGKGMPKMRQQDAYGDLYARVVLTVPETLTDEQRDLAERLRASLRG
jgi:curved DNA-binding protein